MASTQLGKHNQKGSKNSETNISADIGLELMSGEEPYDEQLSRTVLN